jgi:hypothetical protein
MKAVYLVLFACVLVFAPLAQAQRAGVINDPDGFVNVRAEKDPAGENAVGFSSARTTRRFFAPAMRIRNEDCSPVGIHA